MWLTAGEALARLKGKPQSLYASVSRGRIRAKPDPMDSRRSLYFAEDVERLAARARGRRSSAAVAAEAMNWGEPVLASAVSTISGGRLYYRGVDAVELAEHAGLEEVAELLWGGGSLSGGKSEQRRRETGIGALFTALAERAAAARPSVGQGPVALRAEAGCVLELVADVLTGEGEAPLHERLAAHLHRPEAANDLRRALVLLADHELNVSTFAARVTVSTGASLVAGALSGLAALNGPLHGDASAAVMALAADIGAAARPEAALREWLGEGRVIPGFGHRLYPDGDIRAAALLSHIELPAGYVALADAAWVLSGERPNVDFALAALSECWRLPPDAPLTIFALGRSTGWLAHMLEQVSSGSLIRPRARYVGPSPGQRLMQDGHSD